eukprot:1161562-Pelagomonas_calceolata.AAC.7
MNKDQHLPIMLFYIEDPHIALYADLQGTALSLNALHTLQNVPFTKDEDEVLRTHVAKKGTEDWVTIADHLNRLPTSCRDRWRQMGHGHDADLKRGMEFCPLVWI